MADLTRIVEELEKDARQPRILIEAHKVTLEALVALAQRLDRLEKAETKRK